MKMNLSVFKPLSWLLPVMLFLGFNSLLIVGANDEGMIGSRDVSGRIVLSKELQQVSEKNSTSVGVSTLPDRIYFHQMKFDNAIEI